jgi:hypothetical protein
MAVYSVTPSSGESYKQIFSSDSESQPGLTRSLLGTHATLRPSFVFCLASARTAARPNERTSHEVNLAPSSSLLSNYVPARPMPLIARFGFECNSICAHWYRRPLRTAAKVSNRSLHQGSCGLQIAFCIPCRLHRKHALHYARASHASGFAPQGSHLL